MHFDKYRNVYRYFALLSFFIILRCKANLNNTPWIKFKAIVLKLFIMAMKKEFKLDKWCLAVVMFVCVFLQPPWVRQQ